MKTTLEDKIKELEERIKVLEQRPARYWIQIDLMQQESPLEVDAIARKIINATSFKNAKQKYDNLIELLNL